MLVLERKRDESILIGDNIRVTVTAIFGDTVRIGIDAPKAIPVHREEIYMRIKQQGRSPIEEAGCRLAGPLRKRGE